MKFFDSTIASIHRETADAVSVLIHKPTDYPEFQAGQYCAVEADFSGQKERRSYSFSNTPNDSMLRLTIKQIEGGLFSEYFNAKASSGMAIRISEPQGNFVLPADSGPRHLIFFAAGSGITPCFSMISQALVHEPRSRVTLFFGNKTEADVIFGKELKQLSEGNHSFQSVFLFTQQDTERPLHHGRIDFGKAMELMSTYCRDAMSKEFFLCGPSGMIDSVKSALSELGYSDDSVHAELFTTSGSKVVSAEMAAEPAHVAGQSQVVVFLDEQQFQFSLASNGESILDTLLDLGADAPYACKGGVCTSCKAKLLEGTVHMDDNYALTKKELAAGYILTCQSHPTAEKVVLTYDKI